MIEKIKGILEVFCISITDEDPYINFVVDSIEKEIINICNLEQLPEELEHIVIQRVVGYILEQRYASDPTINVEAGIKTLTEGDISISFDNSLDSGRLLSRYIQESKTYGEKEIYSFRRLKW